MIKIKLVWVQINPEVQDSPMADTIQFKVRGLRTDWQIQWEQKIQGVPAAGKVCISSCLFYLGP